jgi:hypothetical protein
VSALESQAWICPICGDDHGGRECKPADLIARIRILEAERDKAREDSGHQRAMKESIRNELMYSIKLRMDKEAAEATRPTAPDSTADGLSVSVAPQEPLSGTPSAPRGASDDLGDLT